MAFRIGQKVVCVKLGAWTPLREGETAPKYQEILTVRSLVDLDGRLNLRFCEIRNPEKNYRQGFMEAAFLASRFRPLIERKKQTDISVFKEILDRESVFDRSLITRREGVPNSEG